MSDTWENAQSHEAEYWGNCNNLVTFSEFTKQEMYGREMRLFEDYGTPYAELDMRGKSVLDVGGGPISMMLRCFNAGPLVVADPCNWPRPASRRYQRHGIQFIRTMCEDLDTLVLSPSHYDEVWCYNVLQHVDDPAKVVKNALARLHPDGVFRLFEWMWIPADKCHLHILTPEKMMDWLQDGCATSTELVHLQECWSDAFAFVAVVQKRRGPDQGATLKLDGGKWVARGRKE